MKIVLFALVSGTSAILFGGGGGGGCGSGGFNPPRLGCQRTYFTIPTIAISSCGGGRKKRSVESDAQCTDPELRKLILSGIRNDVNESRNNILANLKEKHADVRYLVTCVQGTVVFQSSADEHCSDGKPQLMCYVARANDQARF